MKCMAPLCLGLVGMVINPLLRCSWTLDSHGKDFHEGNHDHGAWFRPHVASDPRETEGMSALSRFGCGPTSCTSAPESAWNDPTEADRKVARKKRVIAVVVVFVVVCCCVCCSSTHTLPFFRTSLSTLIGEMAIRHVLHLVGGTSSTWWCFARGSLSGFYFLQGAQANGSM